MSIPERFLVTRMITRSLRKQNSWQGTDKDPKLLIQKY